MTSQFNEADFHDPMYELATEALDDLRRACRNQEPELTGDVVAYGYMGEQDHPLVLNTTSIHRVPVLSDISPNIMYGSDLPSDYVVGMLGSFAVALVDHVNLHESNRGQDLLYPPPQTWLASHLQGIWMTRPGTDSQTACDITVMSAGRHRKIDLVLARQATQETWSVDYLVKQLYVTPRYALSADNPQAANEFSVDTPKGITLATSMQAYCDPPSGV